MAKLFLNGFAYAMGMAQNEIWSVMSFIKSLIQPISRQFYDILNNVNDVNDQISWEFLIFWETNPPQMPFFLLWTTFFVNNLYPVQELLIMYDTISGMFTNWHKVGIFRMTWYYKWH